MSKRKLLVMSDAYQVYTGFANVSRNITDYLHDTEKYDISYLCWFHNPINNIIPPFTYYTTLKDHSKCCGRGLCVMKHEPDKSPEYFKVDKGVLMPLSPGPTCLGGHPVEHDKYAFQSLHGIILENQPDLIWTLGDTWMTYHTQFMDIRPCYKWMSYTPIDGSPMPHITEMGQQMINWVETIDRADKPFAFTNFGRDAMMATAEKSNINLDKVGVIFHGCDVDNYQPLENKAELKKKIFGLEDDVFLIGCFSRNQPRKAFHKLMEALALGKEKGYWEDGKIKCYFHCPIKDVGWNLPGLIKWHGLEDVVILNEKLQVGTGPTDSEMNEYYNACDLMTLPSRGEGWGLTYSEAMAAGVPVLMSSFSAHHDWAKGAAARIETACVDAEPITNIDRAIVDVPDYCEKIKAFYDNIFIDEMECKFGVLTDYQGTEYPEFTAQGEHGKRVRQYFSKKGRELAETELSWTKICGQWEKALDELDTSSNIPYPKFELPKQINLEDLLDKEKKDRILYVMPGTYGDVFISTGVVASIKANNPDKDIYFATLPNYKSILDGNKDIYKVLDYSPIFNNMAVMNSLFEVTHTPFMETQNGNNWVKNGHGNHFGDVYAIHCGVTYAEPFMQITKFQQGKPDKKYVAIHVKTGQEPKDYKEYGKLSKLIGDDYAIVQVGAKTDPDLEGSIDMRGVSIHETAGIIDAADLFIGGDSVCAHIAAYVETPRILFYASTFPELTATVNKAKDFVVQPSDRYGCDRPCHMAVCNRGKRSCMDTLNLKAIVQQLSTSFPEFNWKTPEPPTLSGYTTTRNPDKYYPWRQSITSLLGFCDEVVVVDAMSTDGTWEELEKWTESEPKLKIKQADWDEDDPAIVGKHKAYARKLCTQQFCWQMDCDEIVHENDYEKIRLLLETYPSSSQMIILPVMDLYGDPKKVRTDRGLYKWRLSENHPWITHGVPKKHQKKDANGVMYFDRKACDSCFPLDERTGEDLAPMSTFITGEMMQTQQYDVNKFIKLSKDAFQQLPAVWHFSWHDLDRRMHVDLEFWDIHFQMRDRADAPEEFNRFFPDTPRDEITDDLIKARAAYLKDKKLDGSPMPVIDIDWCDVPAVMKEYLNA